MDLIIRLPIRLKEKWFKKLAGISKDDRIMQNVMTQNLDNIFSSVCNWRWKRELIETFLDINYLEI